MKQAIGVESPVQSSIWPVALMLFLVAFVSYANNMLVAPLLTKVALAITAPIEDLGYLVTVYGLTMGVFSLVAGPLSDKFGRKRVIVAATLATALTTLLFSLSWNLASLYTFRILNAIAAGPLLGSALAAVGDYIPQERRGRAMGLVTSALFMAVVAAVPAGLTLSRMEGFDWRTAFHFMSLLALAVGALVLVRLETLPPPNPAIRIRLAPVFAGFARLLAQAQLRGMAAVFFLIYLASGIYIVYFPSWLILNRAISIDGLIFVYFFGGVFAFSATQLAGHCADRVNRRKLAIIASACVALSSIGILHAPTTAASIMYAALCSGIVYMSGESFRLTMLQTEAVSLADAGNRGSFMGMIGFLIATGSALGAGIGSLILALTKQWRTTQPGADAPAMLMGYEYSTYASAALIAWSMLLIARGARPQEQPAQ